MERALGRATMILGGLMPLSLFGLALSARYDAGLAPVVFIVWIYAPCALLALMVSIALRWEHLWVAFAAIGLMAIVVLAALGGVRVAFWLAVVPAAGALAATIPHPWTSKRLIADG